MSVAEAFFWVVIVPFYMWLFAPQFRADFRAWRERKSIRLEIDKLERMKW